MTIFFDTTKAGRAGHHSGIQRVSSRVRRELAEMRPGGVVPVRWPARGGSWQRPDGQPWRPAAGDWLFTPEVFAPSERAGFDDWLASPGCRTAAVFHDAIPLRFPQITWTRSVARHPAYLKMLARFDRVVAVSEASREDLVGFWRWAQPPRQPTVAVVPWGADGVLRARVRNRDLPPAPPQILTVGILEPRKNQTLLLDAAEMLWRSGLDFELHFVGRENPEFGRPIVQRIRDVVAKESRLCWHGPLNDQGVAELLARCRLAAFPSLAEGNGLPVLEALWAGVPCVCSGIPPLMEHASGGGCVALPPNDAARWAEELRSLLTDDVRLAELTRAALNRPLPTWRDAATAVQATLD
jgi:glycosyltransferase involved in cell wall biosynthesis